jgi:hypothetical protein
MFNYLCADECVNSLGQLRRQKRQMVTLEPLPAVPNLLVAIVSKHARAILDMIATRAIKMRPT